MDWAEGAQDSSKEAVAGSVISSSTESRAVLLTPSPSSSSAVSTTLPALKTTSTTLSTTIATGTTTATTSVYCNYNEVAGRLTLGASVALATVKEEGGHNNNNNNRLITKHNHQQKKREDSSSSSSSPISLVVVQEDDKEQKQPTDLSNPNKNRTSHHQQHHPQEVVLSLTTRKNKPIPPPLDLSIGANTNLSLHHHHHHPQPQSTFNPPHHHHHNHHINNQQIHNHQYHQHQPYLGSPKFTQSDKNLPLRKRWHSWSPVPMNGQEEDSIVPLYPDSHNNHNMPNKTGLAGVGDTAVSTHSQQQQQQQQQQNQYHQPYSSPGPGGSNYGGTRNWVLDYTPVSTTSNNGLRIGLIGNGTINNNNHNGHMQNNTTSTSTANNNHNNSNNNDMSNNLVGVHIQTPTPFYTPNEPSPKFMNSPVFSYSNPDTSLYQGPFSPMRASSLYPPPSSPFTNLSLNSPLGPLSATGAPQTPGINSAGGMGNSCFNMIPSTLLSPAPSQASTNSLSYEDLHEKSLSFFTPAWSIFMSGTKVRFVTGMNSMDWYLVDFLAQSGDSLGLKGEYAPHGLEVRKFIVTSSAKERIQVTFYPNGDLNHPTIEVNCEPGHPFMVDKKGWCAVKPEVFQEIYGTQCQNLECGDVCLSLSAARSPNQYPPSHQTQQQHHHQHHQQNAQVFPTTTSGAIHNHQNHNGHNVLPPVSLSSGSMMKLEPVDEKMIPISVVPQTQNMPMPISCPATIVASRKTFASPISAPASPAKKPKDGSSHNNNNNNHHPNVPGETKGRRPMNAFLLFAKDKRPELIQMYPGKDNRSISVLLGEAWQSLAPSEKEKYASNARARAEEQKRIHPDCWKRKRSQSTSS